METTTFYLPFYIALFVHLTSLIVGFGSVVVMDTCGLMWLLGRRKMSDISRVAEITQPLIWIGWGGLVASGSALLYMKGFIDGLTWIKLFFVAMLGINGIFLHTINTRLKPLGDAPIPGYLFFRIGLASTVSQLGWWGAMTIGFLHRQWESYIPWPSQPAVIIGIIAFTILLVAFSGEVLYRGISRHQKGHLSSVGRAPLS